MTSIFTPDRVPEPASAAEPGPHAVVVSLRRSEGPVAPRGDLIARLEGLTSDRAVRDPSDQQGRHHLSEELTGSAHHRRHPAGGLEPRPTLDHRSIEGGSDTPKLRRSQAKPRWANTPSVDLLIMRRSRLGGGSGWHGRGTDVVAAIVTRPPDRRDDGRVR